MGCPWHPWHPPSRSARLGHGSGPPHDTDALEIRKPHSGECGLFWRGATPPRAAQTAPKTTDAALGLLLTRTQAPGQVRSFAYRTRGRAMAAVTAAITLLLLGSCVRAQVVLRDPVIMTVVGGGVGGALLSNATNLHEPRGVAAYRDRVYIADSLYHRVLLLNVTTGLVTIVVESLGGDGGLRGRGAGSRYCPRCQRSGRRRSRPPLRARPARRR